MIYCAIKPWNSNDSKNFKISIKAKLLLFVMILGFAAPFPRKWWFVSLFHMFSENRLKIIASLDNVKLQIDCKWNPLSATVNWQLSKVL